MEFLLLIFFPLYFSIPYFFKTEWFRYRKIRCWDNHPIQRVNKVHRNNSPKILLVATLLQLDFFWTCVVTAHSFYQRCSCESGYDSLPSWWSFSCLYTGIVHHCLVEKGCFVACKLSHQMCLQASRNDVPFFGECRRTLLDVFNFVLANRAPTMVKKTVLFYLIWIVVFYTSIR